MRTQSKDTSEETEKVLIDLIRKLSIKDKMKSVLSISSQTTRLSKRAIKRVNPGKSKQELDLLFVEYHYGKQLADNFKKYLDSKDNDSI